MRNLIDWLARYGQPRRPRRDEADPLLECFMPAPEVVERHHLALAAPPEIAFAAAQQAELDSSRIIRAIFRARELILRAKPDETPRHQPMIEMMKAIGWGMLAETPCELVFGAVTEPWQPNPVFRPLPANEFAAYHRPGHVKIAWTLRVDPTGDGGSIFRTETRAVATDAVVRPAATASP